MPDRQDARSAAQRRAECVERWPECESGAYDPRCCRFPKSCSCNVRPEEIAAITYAEASPREKLLADALAFYAEPETYFAITFLPDPPCGDFVEDFEELEGGLGHPDGGKWVKPGKRAREALRACFVPSDGETA